MITCVLLLLAQALAGAPADPAAVAAGAEPAGAAAAGTLTLAEAVRLARARSPFAEAARAQADGAARAARAAGRLADPTLDLRMENWRPGASDFVAGTDADVFAVATQPLDLFTRGGRKAQARGESAEADGVAHPRRARRGARHRAPLRRGGARARPRRGARGAGRRTSTTWSRRWRSASARATRRRPTSSASARRRRAPRTSSPAPASRRSARRPSSSSSWAGRSSARPSTCPRLPPAPEGDVVALAEAALSRRPDVLAARARAARADGTLALERGRRWPDLALAGGYKRTDGLDTAVVGVVTTRAGVRRATAARSPGPRATRGPRRSSSRATLERARAEAAVLVRAARALAARAARVDGGPRPARRGGAPLGPRRVRARAPSTSCASSTPSARTPSRAARPST